MAVWRFSEVDPIFGQFIPYEDLEFKFGVGDKVVTIRQSRVVLSGTGQAVGPTRVLDPFLVLHLLAGFQGKVVPRCFLAIGVPQLPDGSQEPVAVVLQADPNGIKVRSADLLADLQVIIAIIQEGLHVLDHVEPGEPVQHQVGTLAHPGCVRCT